MKKTRLPFRLSQEDSDLLAAKLRISDPRGLPNLRERVPADVALVEVLQAYEIPRCPRATWPRCCTCNARTRHLSGYVVAFSDGENGLLGHDCGEIKHNLNYASMLQRFSADATRAGLLRQAIKCFDCAAQLRDFAGQVRTDPALNKLQAFHGNLQRGLPKFYARFQQASGGQVVGHKRQVDYDAMRDRDDRLDSKISRLARERKLDQSAPGVGARLLSDLVASGDKDASKEQITKTIEAVIHQFPGSSFFRVVLIGTRLQQIEQAVASVLAGIERAAQIKLTNTQLRAYIAAMTREVENAKRLRQDAIEAQAFVAPETIKGLVDIWNRLHRTKPPGPVRLHGGELAYFNQPEGSGVQVPEGSSIAIPDVPTRLLRELTEAFSQHGI